VRDQHLVFTIQDDGQGFPQHVIENVAAQQLAEISRRGTGLGLVLAARIAELHSSKSADGKERHGKVVLKNAEGGIFELWLP
jgi:signal transduction histidine kinase